jgi:diguanylate cyclase (GGDEF)-like protein
MSGIGDGAACWFRRVQREMLDLLFAAMPVVLAANVVNSTLIAAVFADLIALPIVLGWWAMVLVVNAVRRLAWVWYRKDGSRSRRWAVVAVMGSFCSGLLWGASGLLFFVPDDAVLQMVLGFVLGGMGAGAAYALAPYPPAFYAYLFPSVLPFCFQLFQTGDRERFAMAAACVIYLGAMVFLVRRAHQWLSESVMQRLDNAKIAQTLSARVEERTAQLREANEQLRRDIAERQRAEAALADYGSRQAAIAEFGRIALSGIDLQALFAKAVLLIRDRLGVTGAAILESAPRPGETLLNSAAVGSTGGSKVSAKGSVVERAATSVVTVDGVQDTQVGRSVLDRISAAAATVEVTIPSSERPFGSLFAFHAQSHQFSADDISFLQSIANMLAAAVERKRAELQIQTLALHDPLTGLPNRTLFRDHLLQGLARTRRSGGVLAVLLLDLDQFKDVNDTLGHPTGDHLLAAVGARLKACIRETDSPARLGGDEFGLILADLPSREDAASVAQHLVTRLCEPFVLEGHEIHVGASVGITVCPSDGVDVDEVLRNADLALYRAKMEGGKTFKFYEVNMAAQVEARKTIERDLRRAVHQEELCLLYQPQFNLADDRIAGAEALLRWRHPTLGMLPPDDFIPVAEACGLIIPLGRWVIERASEDACARRRYGLPPIITAVNLSLTQCRRSDLVGVVEALAKGFAMDPAWLEFEVTEQLFLPPESSDCVETLQRLRGLGVTISIDDFGTGYSSLGRLRGLPVNKVKIDRCFVGELGHNRDAEVIVRAIIALASSLGLTVTAEGVETEEQLAFLKAEGCHSAQGFYLSRPLPPDDLAALLAQEPETRGGRPRAVAGVGRS